MSTTAATHVLYDETKAMAKTVMERLSRVSKEAPRETRADLQLEVAEELVIIDIQLEIMADDGVVDDRLTAWRRLIAVKFAKLNDSLATKATPDAPAPALPSRASSVEEVAVVPAPLSPISRPAKKTATPSGPPRVLGNVTQYQDNQIFEAPVSCQECVDTAVRCELQASAGVCLACKRVKKKCGLAAQLQERGFGHKYTNRLKREALNAEPVVQGPARSARATRSKKNLAEATVSPSPSPTPPPSTERKYGPPTRSARKTPTRPIASSPAQPLRLTRPDPSTKRARTPSPPPAAKRARPATGWGAALSDVINRRGAVISEASEVLGEDCKELTKLVDAVKEKVARVRRSTQRMNNEIARLDRLNAELINEAEWVTNAAARSGDR